MLNAAASVFYTKVCADHQDHQEQESLVPDVESVSAQGAVLCEYPCGLNCFNCS